MLKRILPFLPVFFLVACFPSTTELNSNNMTMAIQTLTATVWTPTPITPTATPAPNTLRVVEILNNAMQGSDPLAETIEARFSVVDVQVMADGPMNLAGVIKISVDCEWIFTNSCTPEESFVALMRALTANDKTLGKILEQIPTTIHTLQVAALDRMYQRGMIIANWNDILDYASGRINGNQLGARIVRLSASP